MTKPAKLNPLKNYRVGPNRCPECWEYSGLVGKVERRFRNSGCVTLKTKAGELFTVHECHLARENEHGNA